MNINDEYDERINKVLNYIDKYYYEDMSLNSLSSIAGFSSFHFHRIFIGRIGESLHQYIKRIKLSKAAYFLLYEKK